MRRKPVIGEKLYSLNVGNAARYCPGTLTPVIVVSVGRKYFQCQVSEGRWKTEFRLDTWAQKTEYAPTECLYESPQEYEEEKECGELTAQIKKVFSVYGDVDLSLGQLRAIVKIIQEGKKK